MGSACSDWAQVWQNYSNDIQNTCKLPSGSLQIRDFWLVLTCASFTCVGSYLLLVQTGIESAQSSQTRFICLV